MNKFITTILLGILFICLFKYAITALLWLLIIAALYGLSCHFSRMTAWLRRVIRF